MRELTNLEKRIQRLCNQALDPESFDKLSKLHVAIQKYNGLIEVISVTCTHKTIDHFHYTPNRFWEINSNKLSECLMHINPESYADQFTVGYTWFILHGFPDGEHIGYLEASKREYDIFLSKMPEAVYARGA